MKIFKYFILLLFVLPFNESFSQKNPVKLSKPIDGSEIVKYNKNNSINMTSGFSNKFPDKKTSSATISYSPTGIYSIYDLQSNACPQEIWQDPFNPANVHAVFMYSNTISFTDRSCYYFFSSNYGAAWIPVTNLPGAVRSGFPSISGFDNGNAVVGLHASAVSGQETRIYYTSTPGSNVFTELLPGGQQQIWPKVLAIGNNNVVFASSINGPTSPSYTNTVTNFTPPGTFSGWIPFDGESVGSCYLAKAPNGKIGMVYMGSFNHPNDLFYTYSTDNGLTWSIPLKILDWELSSGGLGCERGCSIVFGNNNEPYIAFNTSFIDLEGYYPELPSEIRVWSPLINGGVPIIVADSNSVPFFRNTGNVSDEFLPLCRPVIGKSNSGSALIIAFSATSGNYSPQDLSSFYSVYLTKSFNNGTSWDLPEKITPNVPLRDWKYVSISPGNDVSNNQLKVQMVCQADSVAGSFVTGGSPMGKAELISIRYTTDLNSVPSVPVLNSPVNGSNTGLTPLLGWNNSSNVDYYRVQLSKDSTFSVLILDVSSLITNQYQIQTSVLNFDTTYFWKVNAFNSIGNSGWSSAFKFRTFNDVPAAPVLTSPLDNSVNISLTPTLDWSNVTGSISYKLQLSADSNFSAFILNIPNIPASQYVVPGSALIYNTKYFWRVNSANSNGQGQFSTVWNFSTLAIPVAPVLTSPLNSSTGVILTPLLNWSNTSGASLYRVQLSIDSVFSNIIFDQDSLTISQVSVPSPLLTYSTKYYWRVNAGNIVGTGPWSDVWNFVTLPISVPSAPILNLPLDNATGVSVTPFLDWVTVTTAERYRVNIATDLNFNNLVFDKDTILESEYIVPLNILTHNVLYFWRVNATNSSGTGSWSSVRLFRTGLTEIQLFSSEIPVEFKLFENYPNPFNPSTKIRFDLPNSSFVNLIVYDLTGKVVTQLINENLQAGSYIKEFNSTNLPSGVYFYKLVSGEYTDVKRMVLLK